MITVANTIRHFFAFLETGSMNHHTHTHFTVKLLIHHLHGYYTSFDWTWTLWNQFLTKSFQILTWQHTWVCTTKNSDITFTGEDNEFAGREKCQYFKRKSKIKKKTDCGRFTGTACQHVPACLLDNECVFRFISLMSIKIACLLYVIAV